MMNILLVEPEYKSGYPPLGLLKIGTYHKNRGDQVRLIRGKIRDFNFYDRVYISTLFSFQHVRTIDTILYYKSMVKEDLNRIFVGGIYASLFPNIIYDETGIYPHVGLLDRPGILGNDDVLIDNLVPDYSLLDELDYDYGLADCYFGYATRGCPNKCKFCAVHKIEPNFQHYTGLYKYISAIKENFGEKQNMVLMDNNVLASSQFKRIINDIRKLGFERGAKLNGKKRYVDFNQGLDSKLINNNNAELLNSICIKPLRIAYDHAKESKIFESAVRILNNIGIKDISTYVLYNYNDTPKDLYNRLRHCVDLNEELGISIYSFPMRYIPLNRRDRTYLGPNWSKRQIRGLQCILNVTNGLVSHRKDFFLRAFGESDNDFLEIISMPDHYILNRDEYEDNDALEWRKKYRQLTISQKKEFKRIVGPNDSEIIKEALSKVKANRIKLLIEPFVNS